MDPSGRGGAGETSPVLVLVVGVGRSGTSLVQSMLHAHPALVFLPETHFLRKYVAPPLTRRVLRWGGVDELLRRLEGDAELERAGVPVGELLEPFVRERRSFEPVGVYRRLLQLYLAGRPAGGDSEVAGVGDKDPRLLDFLPSLAGQLPDARVVHVVRDPRDVLVSRRNAAWSRGRPDLLHILTYRAQMERGRRWGRCCFGDRYLEVRYEDLLREPRTLLGRLCRHVGVDFDPSMMSFGDAARELVSGDEWQWKKETTEPLKRDNVGNWKGGVMDAGTRRLVERICIEPFPDLGYEAARAESERIGPLEKARLATLDRLGAWAARAYPLRTLVD